MKPKRRAIALSTPQVESTMPDQTPVQEDINQAVESAEVIGSAPAVISVPAADIKEALAVLDAEQAAATAEQVAFTKKIQDQIFAQATEVAQPVVDQVLEPVVVPVTDWGVPLSERTLKVLSQLEKDGGALALIQIKLVLNYVKVMRPGQTMPVDQGVHNQIVLWRAIRSIIEHSDQHFRMAFSALLLIAEDYKDTTFNDMYLFRFMEDISLNDTEQRGFRAILTLIKVAGPVSTRKENVKALSFEKLFKHGFTETAKSRVMDYFQIR